MCVQMGRCVHVVIAVHTRANDACCCNTANSVLYSAALLQSAVECLDKTVPQTT